MADRVVVMHAGRVEQEGAAEDLYERPDTMFVASFVGSPPINLFDGEANGAMVEVHEASIPLAATVRGPVVLGIRPESVQVAERGTPARVTAAEPMGREVLYTADSGLGVIRFLEAGAEPRHREGDSLHLHISPASALLFNKASGRRIEVRIAA
jgi:ABC-type sugar transport system ATPase subunit